MSSTRPPTPQWKWWVGGALVTLALAVLFPIIIVSGFYLEEDARGAAAWKSAVAEIEAHGESVDRKKYLPAPIPDTNNFGALPVFQTTTDSKNSKFQKAMALNSALDPVASRMVTSKKDEGSAKDKLPYLEKWTSGNSPDMAYVQKRLEDVCRNVRPDAPIPDNAAPTDLLEILCPMLGEFHSQNLTRSDCLFPLKYDVEPPTDISFGPISVFIRMGKILVYEERLALYEKNPQLALDDLAVGWKVITGLHKQPLLISGLVANGVSEMQLTVVQQGLNDHAWDDSQLKALDDALGKIDILADGRFVITGDIVVFDLASTDYYEKHRFVTARELAALRGESMGIPESDSPNYLGRILFWLTPKGWFDQDKALDVRFRLLGTATLIDPAARRVFSEKEKKLMQSYHGLHSPVFPDKPFLNSSSFITSSVKTVAYCQVHLDEARIACRLERYHLLHGSYPDSLNALVPDFGTELPHDIMTGDSYHYKLLSGGSYLLYSVAWNQADDGGAFATTPSQSPRDAADWVWKNHLDSEITK